MQECWLGSFRFAAILDVFPFSVRGFTRKPSILKVRVQPKRGREIRRGRFSVVLARAIAAGGNPRVSHHRKQPSSLNVQLRARAHTLDGAAHALDGVPHALPPAGR